MGGYEPRIEVAVKMQKIISPEGLIQGAKGLRRGGLGIGVGGCEPINECIVKRA